MRLSNPESSHQCLGLSRDSRGQTRRGLAMTIYATMLHRKAILLFLVCFLAWLFSSNSLGASHTAPLPTEQAFALSVSIQNPKELQLEWHIAPGYYLYTKKTHITVLPPSGAAIHLPQGELQYDKVRGKYEAYSGNIIVPILLTTNESRVSLRVDYQGCSHDGFCYPPVNKRFLLDMTHANSASNSISLPPVDHSNLHALLTNQHGVKALLENGHVSIILLLFVGLGLLLAFTPCVLPMIPILTGIIVGHHQFTGTKRAFFLSLSYVLGMASAYAILGLIAASMGSSLQVWLQKPVIIVLTSGLFVLLALSLFGLYELRLPNRLQNHIVRWSHYQKGGTHVGVVFMGALSTLIVSPCVTAPLVGVLMYIAETGNLLFGASALFMMGLGMGLPLLLIGGSAGKWLPKSGPWMEVVKQVVGLLMLGMAIWLLSRIISLTLAMLFWGILLVIIAIFLSLFLPRYIGKHKWYRGLGCIVGMAGLLIMVGGINLDRAPLWLQQNQLGKSSFIIVHDVHHLKQQLALAHAAKRSVIVDFYADWCASCVAMDRNVFAIPNVQQKLKNYVLLRADLSANNAADEALLKHFNIIAPPTVLFFDRQGHEISASRIVGEVDAKEFLGHLSVT